MINTLRGLTLAASPILVVVILVGLAAWRDRVREAAAARQIRLTDAIDAELGPVAAPVVTKRLWGPWQVRIAVPFTRTARVAKLIADRAAHPAGTLRAGVDAARGGVRAGARSGHRNAAASGCVTTGGRAPGEPLGPPDGALCAVADALATSTNFRQHEDCRRALLEFLDVFVQAGWPSARRLTYRLEEIFP